MAIDLECYGSTFLYEETKEAKESLYQTARAAEIARDYAAAYSALASLYKSMTLGETLANGFDRAGIRSRMVTAYNRKSKKAS